MPTFKYRTKGSRNTDWVEASIEASDLGQTEDKLDAMYGVKRDDNGEQINGDMITVEVLR
jgi:hypothetical protein